jgi:hypothetical protein
VTRVAVQENVRVARGDVLFQIAAFAMVPVVLILQRSKPAVAPVVGR